MPRPLVFVASPWQGGPKGFRQYLTKAVADSFARGEAPIASHGFYPRYLKDEGEDRELGLGCGLILLGRCDILAVYADHGITTGMQQEISYAAKHRIKVDWRYIMVKGPKWVAEENLDQS